MTQSPHRARSHCRFKTRGAEYVRESGMKRMSSSTERQCDRTLLSHHIAFSHGFYMSPNRTFENLADCIGIRVPSPRARLPPPPHPPPAGAACSRAARPQKCEACLVKWAAFGAVGERQPRWLARGHAVALHNHLPPLGSRGAPYKRERSDVHWFHSESASLASAGLLFTIAKGC